MSGVLMTPPAAALAANRDGMAALQAGDATAAQAAFRAATEADPMAGPLWKNLAHACRLLGDDVGERTALDRALALDRTDFAAQLRIAQLLQRTGQEREALPPSSRSPRRSPVNCRRGRTIAAACANGLGRRSMRC